MEETSAKKRKKPAAGRFLLGLGIAVLVAAAALAVWYLADRRPSFDYLPAKFRAYVQVPSLRRVYEEWIDLKAADAVLSSAGLEALRKGLVDFRGTQASKSAFIRSLIDVRADIMLLADNSVLAVLDMGPRSLLSRLAPVAGPLLSVENLSFTKKAALSYFEYRVGDKSFYASPAGNLIVLSTSAASLEAAFALKGGADSFQSRTDASLLKSLSRSGRGLRFLADSGSLLEAPLSSFRQGKALLGALTFPRECLADIDLSNREASLDASLSMESSLPELASILSGKRARSQARDILPASTAFMLGLNLPSLESLYGLLSALDPELRKTLDSASQASKLALGMSLEELAFSWSGGEAGVIQVGSSGRPVAYVAVRDERKRAEVFDRLFASPLVTPESLEMDGEPMTRIAFPWYVAAAFEVAGIEFDAPYLATQEGFLFASQDPEALSACLSSLRSGHLLRDSSPAVAEWDGTGLLYSFFDSSERPFFLSGRDPLSAVLAEYGQASIQAIPSGDGVLLGLRALPSANDRPVALSGFPVKLDAELTNLAVARFPGQASPRIIASGPKGIFVIDPSLPGKALRVEGSGAVRLPPSGKRFWSLGQDGLIGLWDPSGAAVAPFPQESRGLESMPPIALASGLLMYSKEERGLILMDDSGRARRWGPELDDPVLSSPARSGDGLAFATKGFDSRLYLCGTDGGTVAGWPQEAGGISFGSPALSSGAARPLVSFLSQAGQLSLRDYGGTMVQGFPVQLRGTFHASPVFARCGDEEMIACLDSDGRLSLLDLRGNERMAALAEEGAGKEARLSAFDLDRDGYDEFFIHGSGGLVSGFAIDGSPLPGFPLAGNLAVDFGDMDNDGDIDVVSASRDGTVYAVSIRPRGGSR